MYMWNVIDAKLLIDCMKPVMPAMPASQPGSLVGLGSGVALLVIVLRHFRFGFHCSKRHDLASESPCIDALPCFIVECGAVVVLCGLVLGLFLVA